jgi:integrase
VQRYILQRDLAFFNLLANTGDRAGDLGALLVEQMFMLPDKEGVMLNITKGKITNICDPRVVIVLRSSSSEFLAGGYVFRPLDAHSKLSMKSFKSSAANVRLKLYLKNLNLWDDETPHSTRSGCALTMSWLGLDKEKIKQHAGWKSDSMFQHYTAGKAMCDKFTSAKVLSSQETPRLQILFQKYSGVSNFEKLRK